MKHSSFILIICLLVLTATPADARRTHLTDEQKAQLSKAQTIYAHVLTLTERGRQAPGPIQEIVKNRLEKIGYAVVTTPDQAYDVEVKVKCEERKTWEGTTASGGDAELADAPLRLWKGPACLIGYRLGNKDLDWYKEVRTSFEDSISAAKAANQQDAGAYALSQLQLRLEEYDFPLLLTAEWGQVDRLLRLLDSPNTHKLRKVKILSILSDLHAEEALPKLTEILKDKNLNAEAITALAGTGADSIPLLIDLFQNSKQATIKAAAAKSLGDVAAKTGNPRTIPPLVEYLKGALAKMETSEDINFPVLTEVVWSIGKLRDDRSMKPMAELQEKIWLIFDNSAQMTKLREATNWSYKQLDLDGHIS